jgi:hypothetical protein
MGQTLTLADAILKEFYEGAIRETLNNEVLLKKYLNENSRPWTGRHVRFPVHNQRNSGVGARAEAAALPTAGNQGTVEARVTSAYVYGRIDLTGQIMAADKNAFAESLGLEMQGIKKDVTFDLGRQSYGEGLGILAVVAASASEGTTGLGISALTVHNQFAAPGYPGARYVNKGGVVDIGTLANVSAANAGATVSSTIISQNSGTTTDSIALDASATSASEGYFVFNRLAGGAGVEMKGLRAVVDDQTATNVYGNTGGFFNNSTIFNIDRDSVKGWNASVLANSGTERILDSFLMQKFMSKVKKESGHDLDIFFGEYDVIDAFWDSVASDRRFATKTFDAGNESVTFNGKTMVKDLLAPYNELYGLNRDALAWYELMPSGFADDDGSILKYVNGFDRWEAFFRVYAQIAPDRVSPNATGVIRDIKTNLA